MSLTAPSNIISLLEEHGLRLSKRLGQHFLADANILAKIVTAAELKPKDAVLEIGAGVGTMTVPLAEIAGHVAAIELDRGFVEILSKTLAHLPNVEIIHADVLRFDLAGCLGGRAGRWKVVANLPYSITTPVIVRLIEEKRKIRSMILMVQREVADRLLASPSDPAYGSISVLVQAHAAASRVMNVPRTCFFPRPNVDSAVIRLDVRRPALVPRPLEHTFEAVLRAAFGQRRKTLLNALLVSRHVSVSREAALQALSQASIDPGRRGESLSPEEFIALAKAVRRVCHNPRQHRSESISSPLMGEDEGYFALHSRATKPCEAGWG